MTGNVKCDACTKREVNYNEGLVFNHLHIIFFLKILEVNVVDNEKLF